PDGSRTPSCSSASRNRGTTWPSWCCGSHRNALREQPNPCRGTQMDSGPAGGSMLLSVERTDQPRGFRLVGELDASNVGMLSDALHREVGQGGDLTLDLAVQGEIGRAHV